MTSIRPIESGLGTTGLKADNTYRSAWEASPLAIITLDERGCVRSCNPSSEQLFQRHSDQLIGQLLRSMAHALDRGAVQQMISEALAGRKPARQEIRFLRPGQQIVVTGFNAAPVGPDDDGAVCIIRDINHEKALRPQLLHTERMASIGKVASVVAHELNNALAGALGCLQLVPRSPDPAIQELWDSMASELRRSADIVRELKGYARAEEGMSDQIELPKLFGRLETLRRYQRSTHPSPLEVTIEPGVPGLVGNGNQLLQAALGVRIDAIEGVVEIDRPLLPSGIDRLNITRLQIGDGEADLTFQQMGTHTVVMPRRTEGPVAVRTLG